MDVVIRLGVRIEMHWALFSIGTLQLNSSRRLIRGSRCGRNAYPAREMYGDVNAYVRSDE